MLHKFSQVFRTCFECTLKWHFRLLSLLLNCCASQRGILHSQIILGYNLLYFLEKGFPRTLWIAFKLSQRQWRVDEMWQELFFSAVRCHGEIRVDECGRFFVFVLLDITECSIAVQLVAVTNAIYKYIFAVTNGLLFCFIAKMFVISTTIWAHYTKKGTLLARSFQRANVLLTIESRFFFVVHLSQFLSSSQCTIIKVNIPMKSLLKW